MIEIFTLTKERGLIEPVIALDEGFKVTIWRPAANTDHDTDHDTDQATNQATDQATDQATNKAKLVFKEIVSLTDRLVLIFNSEMSRQELMDILDLKHTPNFRDNYLTPALDDGLIEMTLPDKLQSKSQKYRLTGKGRMLQKRLLEELK